MKKYKSSFLDGKLLLVSRAVIITFDGKPISSPAPLQDLVFQAQPGQKVEPAVVRDGRPIQIEVMLQERSDVS